MYKTAARVPAIILTNRKYGIWYFYAVFFRHPVRAPRWLTVDEIPTNEFIDVLRAAQKPPFRRVRPEANIIYDSRCKSCSEFSIKSG